MSDRGPDDVLAAGGPIRHRPVLREEALDALSLRRDGTYIDGTFGAGGYTRAMLATPGVRVVALDRDPTAIADGAALAAAEPRLTLVEARFATLGAVVADLGLEGVDGVVLDIGVSSMQFDRAERGFSFRFDGPLDMRMGGDGPSAADIVNGADEGDLADILFRYGDERASRRIARAICFDRKASPFTSTKQLADMIGRVMPGKPGDIHPATRSFQALRIAVNDELGELHDALEAAERVLVSGGRLAVVTFHSIEDRIVKRFLQARAGRGDGGSRHLPAGSARPPASFALPGKQPILPGDAEVAANPRARSAKLRVGTRTDAPPWGADPAARAAVTVAWSGRAAFPHAKGR
ncbi:16S rRNA (cytosine(1402)-N(4))-methyltransferase RsmH [Lichenibacterium minor]|uniref:Ribosomal RNA small subunit methyltransferase H n=1 Tax=Lichenibacterium minor TaxID=2316528 RepID=A0A4Q2U4W7_9HYPH|nr:16S rRNA (cytosine(1402)-N(4))-methyltransferase RsmH [Lichenibacterium minor]RYC30041.1 16S rRNA (cytosine(1402)-N(4))-methyltransferase RsmH [Lichenibacterium minor]